MVTFRQFKDLLLLLVYVVLQPLAAFVGAAGAAACAAACAYAFAF